MEVGGVEKLADLCVCASACPLATCGLRNLRFCNDDRAACMPIMIAPRDESFDATTTSVDVSSLSFV